MAQPMEDRLLRLGPSGRKCYWRCGNDSDSNEHLIPEWIDKAFVVPVGCTIIGNPELRTFRNGIVGRTRVQRVATSLVATRSVCVSCNTGWMSALEKRAKGLLTPLVRGHRRLLDEEAQLQIALWACMKAAVVDARPGSEHGGLCSESIRAAIFERQEPPIDMVARLAAFDEADSFQLHSPHGGGIGSAGPELAQWVTTFVLGHVVVQVLGRTGSALPGVLDQSPGGVHNGQSFTVWPPRLGQVEWPPRVVLNRTDLPQFLTELCPQLEIEPEVCARATTPLRRILPTPEP